MATAHLRDMPWPCRGLLIPVALSGEETKSYQCHKHDFTQVNEPAVRVRQDIDPNYYTQPCSEISTRGRSNATSARMILENFPKKSKGNLYINLLEWRHHVSNMMRESTIYQRKEAS
jgi:hypothetical protein